MHTEIVKLTTNNKEEVLDKATKIIRDGGLVVFPTETVYGLGADVFNEKALLKIFKAKGRPSDNPLIVHIAELGQLKELTDDVSPIQQKLIKNFWPGPLTMIFKKKKNISNIISGGLENIAVRMPSHPFACELISSAGVPIAAPSANISGRPSGTEGDHLSEDLMGRVDMIVDAGRSTIGVESTVVKVESDSIIILRPGAITKEMLSKVVTSTPVVFTEEKKHLTSSPGTKYKHYTPNAKMILAEFSEMRKLASSFKKEGKRVGVICTRQNENFFKVYVPNIFVLGDSDDLKEISRNLYSALRFFDTHIVDVILCESFPKEGLGVAIMDRLERASVS